MTKQTKTIEDYPELDGFIGDNEFGDANGNSVIYSKLAAEKLLEMQSKIDELTEQNKDLQELSAYYRCCALSGELPSDYSVNIIKKKATHEWDEDLSTCVKCGDKDWMADKYCSESKLNKESK